MALTAIMKLNNKLYIVLAYTIAAGAAYFWDPKSSLLSVPFAFVISLILRPLVQTILVGNILLVWPAVGGNPFIIQFEDVCVGTYLLVLVVLFLWVRGSKGVTIAAAALALFAVNVMRVVAVILALHWYGFYVGAAIHDSFYATLTVLGIGIMVYSAYPFVRPLLKPPAREDSSKKTT